MTQPTLCLVAAVARDRGIGYRGDVLVKIPEDQRRFKRITLGSPVVMGRGTWDSMGRALPGRQNIVVTRNPAWHAEGAQSAGSLEAALALAPAAAKIFVIGGADIYALALPHVSELDLTEIDAEFPADTFFPEWNRADFRQTSREAHETPAGLRYAFVTYQRIVLGG
ncbi:MAG: dihydrofolate reductase [Caldimonas sp.]